MAIITGDEFDNIFGGTDGNDSVYGGLANDTLTSTKGKDYLYGGDGIDTLTMNSLTYGFAFGGEGNDMILLAKAKAPDSHTAYGGLGDDQVSGSGWLYGGDGNDTIELISGVASGDAGDDVITILSLGTTSAYAGDGNDTVLGSNHTDDIELGAGDDLCFAGDAITTGSDRIDRINGGAGNDTIYGEAGTDYIEGGDQNDMLFGGAGRDTIFGGLGKDRLNGGSDGDTFKFYSAAEMGRGNSSDQIRDFDITADKLDLSVISRKLHFIGDAAFSNVVGEVRFDAATQSVRVDVNGDGTADGTVKIYSATFDASDLIL